MASDGTNLYVGGYFRKAGGGITVNHIAKWDGMHWSALGGGFAPESVDFSIASIALYGNKVIVSGGPLADGRTLLPALWDGTNWWSLGTGVDGGVNSLAVSKNNIYVAGRFHSAGGKPSVDFAIWHAPQELKIQKAPATAILSWPLLASDYVLEATDDLSAGNWSRVDEPVSVDGNQCTLTNSADGRQLYFRLRK